MASTVDSERPPCVATAPGGRAIDEEPTGCKLRPAADPDMALEKAPIPKAPCQIMMRTAWTATNCSRGLVPRSRSSSKTGACAYSSAVIIATPRASRPGRRMFPSRTWMKRYSLCAFQPAPGMPIGATRTGDCQLAPSAWSTCRSVLAATDSGPAGGDLAALGPSAASRIRWASHRGE
jgi:hypothetical protein